MTRVKVRTRKPAAPIEPPAEAYDRLPRVQLTATDETLWLTRFDGQGRPEVTYPVTVADVANCFQGLGGLGSGLLPADILFWQATERGAAVGLWLPPAMRTITWATGKRARRLTLPLPGFVLVGQGAAYSIFAAKERPATEKARLYHAPLSNVNPSGAICAGSVKFPRCTPATIAAAARLFFESEFNADLSADKVRSERLLLPYLAGLQGRRRFPLRDLVPARLALRDLLTSEASSTARRRTPARVENNYTDPLGMLDDEADDDFLGDGEEYRTEMQAAQLEMMA